jgi:hypothetical protein
VLILEPGRIAYPLIYPHVVDGTLELDSLDSGYGMERGTLYLDSPPAETLIVQARYMSLQDSAIVPVRIHDQTTETRFASDSSARELRVLRELGVLRVQTGQTLNVHGSKTFSVSVNDRGVSDVDQGLSVNVSGKLSNVDVEAYLTDEEGTFIPEGTTERIEEFDRIAIGLSQEQWKLNMGDLNLSHPLQGYGVIERRLQGATGKLEFEKFGAAAAFGIDGTKNAHEVLATADGKQGPYYIGDRNSQQPVIPESERVYLDGVLMESGRDADYVIDYSTGEITFTNYRRIEATSRLEVDYTYAGADYRSDNELAGFSAGPFEAAFYREADSRTHLFHTWSAQQQAILDTLAEGEAILPGGRWVDENQGGYTMEDDHYVWTGYAAGDYEVSFRKVENGAGDYVLDPDSGFFRYVGADSGDYSAEILTTLPARNEALFLSANETLGALDIALSAIGSRTTPNLYNRPNMLLGHAHRLQAGIEGQRLALALGHRLQTPAVWIPSDGDDAGAADRWNCDSLPTAYNEQSLEVSAIPIDSLNLGVEGGHLWTLQHAFRAGLTSSAPFFNLRADWLEHRQRAALDAYPRFGIWTPLAGIGFENFQNTRNTPNTRNTRNVSPMLGLVISPFDKLTLKTQASRRIDQRRDAQWQDTLHYDRVSAGGEWDGERLTSSVNTGIERIAYLDTGETWQAFFADIYTTYTHSTRARLYADLSQQTTQSKTQIVEYVPVEPGTGDYARDPETGEYIPDEQGNYHRVVTTHEGAEPEVQRSANLGADLNFDLVRFWTAFTYSQSPVSNSILASGRITLFPRETLLNLIVEPSYRNQRFPTWGGMDEALLGWGTGLQLRSRVHPDYLLRLEGSYDTQEQYRGAQPLRSRQESSAGLSPIIDLWLRIEPLIGFGTLRAAEPLYYPDLEEIVIRRAWAGSDFQKRFGDWKLTAGGLLTQRQPNVSEDDLPYLISRDDPAGLHSSWTAEVTYSPGKGINLKAEYEGNLYPDERGLENEFELSAGMYF